MVTTFRSFSQHFQVATGLLYSGKGSTNPENSFLALVSVDFGYHWAKALTYELQNFLWLFKICLFKYFEVLFFKTLWSFFLFCAFKKLIWETCDEIFLLPKMNFSSIIMYFKYSFKYSIDQNYNNSDCAKRPEVPVPVLKLRFGNLWFGFPKSGFKIWDD